MECLHSQTELTCVIPKMSCGVKSYFNSNRGHSLVVRVLHGQSNETRYVGSTPSQDRKQGLCSSSKSTLVQTYCACLDFVRTAYTKIVVRTHIYNPIPTFCGKQAVGLVVQKCRHHRKVANQSTKRKEKKTVAASNERNSSFPFFKSQ